MNLKQETNLDRGLWPGFGSIYETYSLSQGTAQKNVLKSK